MHVEAGNRFDACLDFCVKSVSGSVMGNNGKDIIWVEGNRVNVACNCVMHFVT